METQKVGIREFRADLAEYIASTKPVAITRHGETVGYFIPTQRQTADDELRALKQASAILDKILAQQGATEDELVSDFKTARRKKARHAGK